MSHHPWLIASQLTSVCPLQVSLVVALPTLFRFVIARSIQYVSPDSVDLISCCHSGDLSRSREGTFPVEGVQGTPDGHRPHHCPCHHTGSRHACLAIPDIPQLACLCSRCFQVDTVDSLHHFRLWNALKYQNPCSNRMFVEMTRDQSGLQVWSFRLISEN